MLSPSSFFKGKSNVGKILVLKKTLSKSHTKVFQEREVAQAPWGRYYVRMILIGRFSAFFPLFPSPGGKQFKFLPNEK